MIRFLRRPWLSLPILLLVAAPLACDGEATPPDLAGDFAGNFVYTVNDQPFQELWQLTLDEDSDGRVTGSGLQGSEQVDVEGRHDHPDVTLDFISRKEGFVGTLTGMLSDDGRIIEGTYNFSIIFVSIPLTLRKTP